MKNQKDYRACSSCNKFMVIGYTNENLGTYYCTKKCLDSSVSKKEQNEEFENESLYHTDWVDDTTVFSYSIINIYLWKMLSLFKKSLEIQVIK
ncbi:hypothetical protein [Sporosarcina sp. BP05]|uniref:hypothetical protein n=1 Tax=Sporosarcina sp. BP05 TaxID=2758726 RepID=UPI0016473B9C|nr:hypothetical protein [Sporosarcina sp. BP05]